MKHTTGFVRWLSAGALILWPTVPAVGQTIYVDTNATGAGNGGS